MTRKIKERNSTERKSCIFHGTLRETLYRTAIIMRILIVRHADPNYDIDSLTQRGKEEAKLLSKRLVEIAAESYYCSPLGRAKKTASYTLKTLGRKAEILPWLREFCGKVKYPDGREEICWDRLPSEWTSIPLHYTDKWYESELMRSYNAKEEYFKVANGIDELLKKHGYVHDGKIFRAQQGNHDTIVLFCHFGVECVILSHLLGTSPMIFWHNFVALPSSVTEIVTEEREKGIASLRLISFGDTGHLYKGSCAPSFAARFCECFEDDTRH